MFPTSMQGLAGPIVSQLPITPFNMVCTNVPGPQFPLYLLGRKMLHCYPYVPVGGEMAVNCAILSYNGMVYFGFSGDVHAAPDLRRLESLLMTSFTELRAAVGIKPPKRAPAAAAPLPSREDFISARRPMLNFRKSFRGLPLLFRCMDVPPFASCRAV